MGTMEAREDGTISLSGGGSSSAGKSIIDCSRVILLDSVRPTPPPSALLPLPLAIVATTSTTLFSSSSSWGSGAEHCILIRRESRIERERGKRSKRRRGSTWGRLFFSFSLSLSLGFLLFGFG
uniref:Uncharacterized protein n=1 Tax=Ananas comosus var. bracteatus TaxID=296719 RepID=A0A6V7PVK7_ANACO|nr:unnamed protein product [Ananas comosus var. bracteatus]